MLHLKILNKFASNKITAEEHLELKCNHTLEEAQDPKHTDDPIEKRINAKKTLLHKSLLDPHKELWSKEFFEHVKENDVSNVLQMVRKNPKLANDVDHQKRTPLHHACIAGSLSMI